MSDLVDYFPVSSVSQYQFYDKYFNINVKVAVSKERFLN